MSFKMLGKGIDLLRQQSDLNDRRTRVLGMDLKVFDDFVFLFLKERQSDLPPLWLFLSLK